MPEEIDWVARWNQIEPAAREYATRVLTELAKPTYVPSMSSEFAMNVVGWIGPAYSRQFIPARDALEEAGFITYAHGEPVELSPEFRAFIAARGPVWLAVLTGAAAPAAAGVAAAPTAAQPAPGFPAAVEDERFWQRIHGLIEPLVVGEVSGIGEVLHLPTARMGGMRTGGRYSRPDLTYLRVGRYPLSGHKILDVIGVECKTWGNGQQVPAAYEAVAYKRFCTHVYFAYESPSEDVRVPRDVAEVLREHGIGILRMWRDGGADKARLDAEPVRSNPTPERMEQWLASLRELDPKGITTLLHSKFR